jgi:hypothetical protein
MEINNTITPQDSPQSLRGSMKLANASLNQDLFTASEGPDRGFLQSMKDKIKNMFSHKDDPKPAKEPGGWFSKPDGSGSEWRPQSNPPDPKNAYGHWVIDTACGAADWYWVKNSEPAEGPTYGPGYIPPTAGTPAEAPKPDDAQKQG